MPLKGNGDGEMLVYFFCGVSSKTEVVADSLKLYLLDNFVRNRVDDARCLVTLRSEPTCPLYSNRDCIRGSIAPQT